MFQNDLLKAIRMIGSRKQAAKLLGIDIKIINNWFSRDKHVRVEHALMLEFITAQIAQQKGLTEVKAEAIAPYAKKQIICFRQLAQIQALLTKKD